MGVQDTEFKYRLTGKFMPGAGILKLFSPRRRTPNPMLWVTAGEEVNFDDVYGHFLDYVGSRMPRDLDMDMDGGPIITFFMGKGRILFAGHHKGRVGERFSLEAYVEDLRRVGLNKTWMVNFLRDYGDTLEWNGKADKILAKAKRLDDAILERHVHEGLVLPTVVFPTVGKPDYTSGNYENCAYITALHVAAQAFLHDATRDHSALENAALGVSALHKLQDIPHGQELIARGFTPTDPEISDMEQKLRQLFWYKGGLPPGRKGNKWFQSNGYDWLGSPSKSTVFSVVFGYFAYLNFCHPDQSEAHEILPYLTKLVDAVSEKGTLGNLFGNFDPNTCHKQSIGPALLYGMLKCAAHFTGDEKYNRKAREIVDEDDPEALEKLLGRMIKSYPFNEGLASTSGAGSELILSMLNIYMLSALNPSEKVVEACKNVAIKNWKRTKNPTNTFHNFMYHVITGETKGHALHLGRQALYEFPEDKTVDGIALKEKLPILSLDRLWSVLQFKYPMQKWPPNEFAWRNRYRRCKWRPKLEGKMEFTGVDHNFVAYFGLNHGLLL